MIVFPSTSQVLGLQVCAIMPGLHSFSCQLFVFLEVTIASFGNCLVVCFFFLCTHHKFMPWHRTEILPVFTSSVAGITGLSYQALSHCSNLTDITSSTMLNNSGEKALALFLISEQTHPGFH
jgi:hypothetical protein